MITCEFMGRLGNNMFQIVVVHAIAKKHNESPEFRPFPYFNLKKRTAKVENMSVQRDGNNACTEIKYKPNMCIVGFFQRHEYFDHIKDELINIFQVPNDYHPNTIGVHVRRGDFLMDSDNFPTQPVSYYMEAFKRIGIDKKIVFCSDDIEWCKDNFSTLPNVKFRSGRNELDDIYFLANCEAVVMSNSTFSFWQ